MCINKNTHNTYVRRNSYLFMSDGQSSNSYKLNTVVDIQGVQKV